MTTSPLFHLLALHTYRSAEDEPLRAASLIERGFMHCAPDLETTLAVANAFYREITEPVVVVELDPTALSATVRWEAADPAPPPGVAGDVLFPHVHGPLDRAAITRVRYARRAVDGTYLSFEEPSATAVEFDLLPHPEGGWYRRTWASPVRVEQDDRVRPSATAIHFLLGAGETSRWHVVSSAELWFWHRGGPLALQLGGTEDEPSAEPDVVTLGGEPGRSPQAVVPAHTWQRAVATPGAETLVSCVVSPGFDFADFRTH